MLSKQNKRIDPDINTYESITTHMNNDLYYIMKNKWENRENEVWIFYNEKTGTRFNHRAILMEGLCRRAKITPLGDTEKISKKTIGGLFGYKALQTTEIYFLCIQK